jgi:NADH:ubiquinone oxidoreductase subunit F (NADH-binding)
MKRFEKGQGREREIDMLQELTKQVEGHTICGKFLSKESKRLQS